MWRQFVHEYLSFTKKERTGIVILLSLIMVCLVAPFLYSRFIPLRVYDHSAFEKEISQLKTRQADSASRRYSNKNFDENNYTNYYEPSERKYYPKSKGELFYFDPNTASTNDWQRLGVRDKTIVTIQKYLSKGGHFYQPGDIAKIWGLGKEEAERLIPYARIERTEKEYANKEGRTFTNTLINKPIPQVININSSDSGGFISLPGIGSKLAQRIISFREKLGGFYSVEQIKETYGLPDSTFQKIKSQLTLTSTEVKQININTATLEEMKTHPYLRFNLANAIVQYRLQHGNFSSIAELKKIMIVTDELFAKLTPYLTIN